MKTILTTLALATTFGLFTSVAQADSCYTPPKKQVTRVAYCAPYHVKTVEVNRCRYRKEGYDKCGKPVCYWETVVTYKAIYSDGSWKTFAKTFYS